MPIRSRWNIEISSCSLPTWMFGSPDTILPKSPPIFLDADAPDTHKLSLHDLRNWSQCLAVGLQAAGLQQGDRVLFFSGNCISYPVIFTGIVMAGGIFSGANPTYTSRELAYQLKDSEAKFLICHENSLETGVEAAKLAGIGKDCIFISDDNAVDDQTTDTRDGYRNYRTLFSPDGPRFCWEDFNSKDDPRTMCLNYSSGTTGLPKGVEITHYNYISNCTQYNYLHHEVRPETDEEKKRRRRICFLPLYHAMGQTICLVCSPKRAVPVVLMRKYDLQKVLENIQKYKISDLILAPPVLVAMTKSPLTRKYDLGSLERVLSGAAPLRRDVCEAFERLLPPGRLNVKQGWGMTETTCSALGWDPQEMSLSFSVGELNPNCEIKIVDETDQSKEILKPHVSGEIWVKAPNIMKGYWRNPKATAETLTPEGWLKTGDIGYMDEKERFYIVDRKKELIKVRGYQVAPAELEALLLEHADIADAGVIGVTLNDEEVPRAYVVAIKKLSEREIVEWMNQRVSKHKRLNGGVRFIEAIPKNPSGKIMRKILREMVKKETDDQRPRL